MARVSATVTIDRDSCKGCGLCVHFCPPRVLVMSEDYNAIGYHYPILLDGCTGCMNCYRMCPDLVFEVYREPRGRTASGVA